MALMPRSRTWSSRCAAWAKVPGGWLPGSTLKVPGCISYSTTSFHGAIENGPVCHWYEFGE